MEKRKEIEQRVRGKDRLKERERRGWQDRLRGEFRALTKKRGRTQASRERGKKWSGIGKVGDRKRKDAGGLERD